MTSSGALVRLTNARLIRYCDFFYISRKVGSFNQEGYGLVSKCSENAE